MLPDDGTQKVNQSIENIEEKNRAELPASQAGYIYTNKVQQAVAAATMGMPTWQ